MPRLKMKEFVVRNEVTTGRFKVELLVSASGLFYANLDADFRHSIESVFGRGSYETKFGTSTKKEKIKVSSKELDTLIDNIYSVFKLHVTPEIIEEPVILYNIESHVAFAEDDEGTIYPNSGFKDASWAMDKMYGEHHSSNPSKGGYSLHIGARAKLKITHKYGDSENVTYRDYYGGGSHHGKENPAELLNSWCSFELKNPKEMPYTDEAAIFFHNLMLGMAKISQMVQNSTFDKDNLEKLISSGNNLFLPNPEDKDISLIEAEEA